MITKLSHLIPEGGAPIDWQGLSDAGFGAMLADMEKTPQNPAYHAEGDVLAHTKRVCEALVADARYGAMDADDRMLLFLSAPLRGLVPRGGRIPLLFCEDKFYGLFGFAGGADDEAFVVL